MNDDAVSQPVSRCGFVAIVGRPNVGKSTLLNHLVKEKISITSRKPQTTRNSVTGIVTEDNTQIVFVDTPGIHQGHDRAINRAMNRTATGALKGVDLAILVVDKTEWSEDDGRVLKVLKGAEVPVIVAVNKCDQVDDKQRLLPHFQFLQNEMPESTLIPISALQNTNVDTLLKEVRTRLPEGPFHFPEDQITDRSMRFMAAEIIREKITRSLGDELPYQTAVEIEEFKESAQLVTISAVIFTEREGQKRILIGRKGEKLKRIGQEARIDMEKLFDQKVMLNLWIKVKSGWSDSERALRSLGLNE